MLCFTAELGLTDLDYYQYLSYGGNHKVESTNDARDLQETLKGITNFFSWTISFSNVDNFFCLFTFFLFLSLFFLALRVMGIQDSEVFDIFKLVAGILHVGNIQFIEKGNYSQVADKQC